MPKYSDSPVENLLNKYYHWQKGRDINEELETMQSDPSTMLGFMGAVGIKYPKDNLYKALMESGKLGKFKAPTNEEIRRLTKMHRMAVVSGADVPKEPNLLEKTLKGLYQERVKPSTVDSYTTPLGLYRESTGEAYYYPKVMKKLVSYMKKVAPNDPEANIKKVHGTTKTHEATHAKTVGLGDYLKGPSASTTEGHPMLEALKDLNIGVNTRHRVGSETLKGEINRMLIKAGKTPAGNATQNEKEIVNNMALIYNSRGGRKIMDSNLLAKRYREFFDLMLQTEVPSSTKSIPFTGTGTGTGTSKFVSTRPHGTNLSAQDLVAGPLERYKNNVIKEKTKAGIFSTKYLKEVKDKQYLGDFLEYAHADLKNRISIDPLNPVKAIKNRSKTLLDFSGWEIMSDAEKAGTIKFISQTHPERLERYLKKDKYDELMSWVDNLLGY